METLLKKIKVLFTGQLVNTIELSSDEEGELYHLVCLKKTAKGFLFEKQSSYRELDTLIKDYHRQAPTVLIINQGAIHKIVPAKAETDAAVLMKLMPSIDPSNFYIQRIPQNNLNTELISIYRLDDLNIKLAGFAKKGVLIVDVLLGSFHVGGIIEAIEESTQEIQLPRQNLSFQEDELSSFLSASNEIRTYTIGDEQVENTYLSSTAASILFLMSGHQSNAISQIKRNRSEQRFKQLMKPTIYSFLGILFLSLFINFFVFSSYYSKSQSLQAEALSASENDKLYTEVQDKLSERKEFLTSRVPNEFILSYYADRVGHSLPKSIQLEKMNVNPISKKVKKDKVIEFGSQRIFIEGLSTNSKDFNKWIQQLENEEWIQHVSVANYRETNSRQKAAFSITLSIH